MERSFEKNLEFAFILLLLVLGVFYLYTSFGTQMLGEDEGTYYLTAKFMAEGNYPETIFGNMPMNIPPLAPLLYALTLPAAGWSLGAAKAISALFALLTLLLLYAIGKKFNIYFGIFAALLLLSIATFSHFALIAYVEVPIAFFSLLLIYIFLSLDSMPKAAALGALLALSYYIKSSVVVLAGVFVVYALYQHFYCKNKWYIKYAATALTVFAALLAPWALRNITLYNYPYIEGMNVLFGRYPVWADWFWAAIKVVRPAKPALETYTSTFGWIVLVLGIFGAASLLAVKGKRVRDLLTLSVLSVIAFIITFSAAFRAGALPLEPRYLSIIFPQLALLGGFFLWKAVERSKWLLLIILPVLLVGIWGGIATAINTYGSQRYPADYIEAQNWLKSNSLANDLIFTPYGGSLAYFAERQQIWGTNMAEFPELMTTTDTGYIYNTLKKYNASYIYVWRATLAQNYIIPESNIYGAFTYNFLEVIANDTERFEPVFSNQNNWIFKLK